MPTSPDLPFDLTDLRLFVRIVEAGSITAGARAAHLSLPAASARVLAMEASLAVPLLTRGHRGVSPTDAGLTLLQHARGVLLRAEQLRLDLEDQARGRRGHVTLLGTSSAIREYLPDLLGDFLARHREINVSTGEAAEADAVQAVIDGAVDMAVVTELSALRGLVSFDFILNRFALLVPRDHPLVERARSGAISVAQADSYDVVGLPAGSALQDTWEARALQHGVRLNYRVRLPGFDAQARLIERGVGIALMPEPAAQRFARTMAVAALPLSDPHLVRRLLVCIRQVETLSPHARALLDQLRG